MRRPAVICAGGLGECSFQRGWYVYAGSAMGGLAARVRRHAAKTRTLRWHIDYLLACPDARLADVLLVPSARKLECPLNRAVLALPGAVPAFPGFGSSDCREGCVSHLTFFERRPGLGLLAAFAG